QPYYINHQALHSFIYITRHLPTSTLFPTRRSSDLTSATAHQPGATVRRQRGSLPFAQSGWSAAPEAAELTLVRSVQQRLVAQPRSEEHTSELQSQSNLVCRLLLEKKKYGPLYYP